MLWPSFKQQLTCILQKLFQGQFSERFLMPMALIRIGRVNMLTSGQEKAISLTVILLFFGTCTVITSVVL